jgi:hypothetical protein
MEETMRPTTAFDDNVFDINALLHPGTIFDHPKDMLAHPSLSVSEKRAILASWRRSLPAPRCGHRRASRHPSPSTRFWKPGANSTAARAIRRAASRTACAQRRDSWRHSNEQYHGRNQTASTRC